PGREGVVRRVLHGVRHVLLRPDHPAQAAAQLPRAAHLFPGVIPTGVWGAPGWTPGDGPPRSRTQDPPGSRGLAALPPSLLGDRRSPETGSAPPSHAAA